MEVETPDHHYYHVWDHFFSLHLVPLSTSVKVESSNEVELDLFS